MKKVFIISVAVALIFSFILPTFIYADDPNEMKYAPPKPVWSDEVEVWNPTGEMRYEPPKEIEVIATFPETNWVECYTNEPPQPIIFDAVQPIVEVQNIPVVVEETQQVIPVKDQNFKHFRHHKRFHRHVR